MHPKKIFVFIWIIFKCAIVSCLAQSVSNDIRLTIYTNHDKITDSLRITVVLLNKSKDDFLIENDNTVEKMAFNHKMQWELEIFKDSIRKVIPQIIFPGLESEFFHLKKNTAYMFDFYIDFRLLISSPLEIGQENQDYGEYFLQIRFNPTKKVEKKKNGLKISLVSNKVKVFYTE